MTTYNSWGADDPVQETKGGTAQSTFTTGDLLYSSASNTLSKLAIGTEDQVLSVSASGTPEWVSTPLPGGADWTQISSDDIASATSWTKTSGLGTAYDEYFISINGVTPSGNSSGRFFFSDDGGSTYAVPFISLGIDKPNASSSALFMLNDDALEFPQVNSGSYTFEAAVHINLNNNGSWIPFWTYQCSYLTAGGLSGTPYNHRGYNGLLKTTNDIDALRYYPDLAVTRSFTSGTVTVYGR